MHQDEIFDVAIIGGGPAGMMAAFYAGTRGLKPIIVDILDKLGGQCATLYPEKPIFDVAGQAKTTGMGLITSLQEQLDQINYETSLNTHIEKISQQKDEDGKDVWVLNTRSNSVIKARTVVIAVGKGAFEPRKLGKPGENLTGVHYTVQSLSEFDNKDLLIVGGGDSAFDWNMALQDRATSITHIHRTDNYRAHGASIDLVKASAAEGKVGLLPFHEIKEIVGDFKKQVKEVIIVNTKTKEEHTIKADSVVISAGFLTNLGNINEWGLEIEDQKIMVDPTQGYSTNLPGVFAIGDIAHFEGKVELIITSFGEAATTAFYAFKHINGNVKGAAWCAKLPNA